MCVQPCTAVCITALHKQSRVCWLQLSARVVAFVVLGWVWVWGAHEWWKASAVPLRSAGCARSAGLHGAATCTWLWMCRTQSPFALRARCCCGFVLASLALGLFTTCSSPFRPSAVVSETAAASCLAKPRQSGPLPPGNRDASTRCAWSARIPQCSPPFLCRRLGSDGGPWPADGCAQRLFWWSGYILWVLVGLQVWFVRG